MARASSLSYIVKAGIFERVNLRDQESSALAVRAIGAPPEVVDFIKSGAMILGGADSVALAAFSDAFYASATPNSFLLSILAAGAFRSIARSRPGTFTVTSAIASGVSEGGATPVSSMTFANVVAEPEKAVAIIVATKELLGQMTSAALRFLDGELRRSVGRALDALALVKLLDGDAFATVAVSSIAAADILEAAQSALLALCGEFNDPNTFFWVASPSAAVVLSTATSDISGGQAFPTASIRGGEFLSIPLLVSAALDDGDLLLVDASLISATLSAIEVSTSTEAMVDFNLAPPPDVGVSLFQTNSVGVKALSFCTMQKFDRRSVIQLTGITNTAAT